MNLEDKVIDKVRRNPGIMLEKVMRDLRKSGSCRDVGDGVRRLVAGGLLKYHAGHGKKLWPGREE
jgi:hypothetical protein